MVYCLDPVEDPRWQRLVERHPDASVFHAPAWLNALRQTYGYQSFALTTSPPGRELANGLVFCRVNSWLTGNRVVSLPFSDHCQPLLHDQGDFEVLLAAVHAMHRNAAGYIEIRPIHQRVTPETGLAQTNQYWLHTLDLPSSERELLLHVDENVRRIVRRGAKERVQVEQGRSADLVERFFGLIVQTRKRHKVPPQPRRWFTTLAECFGENMNITLILQNSQPAAAVLSLRHRETLICKYICSDAELRKSGCVHVALWYAIQAVSQAGVRTVDFGRTDLTHSGLLGFKNRWACRQQRITYWRYTPCPSHHISREWISLLAKPVIAQLPDGLLTAMGSLLYRHAG